MRRSNILFVWLVLITIGLYSQENIRRVGDLPDLVSETSGVIFYRERLITHNDSGNAPRLYEVDTTSLEIVREVTVSNAVNLDWEDLAQDDAYIYIGDFGNTRGVRRDLIIYRISKVEFEASNTIEADIIRFSYEDQENFMDNGNSDWDAEALIVLQDQLLVLTKQWVTQGTSVYALPKVPGTHTAKLLGSHDLGGLLTGATFNPETGIIFLIGYSELLFPFLVKLSDFTGADIFNGTIGRTDLGIGPAQVEAITYVNGEDYFFTSESVALGVPSLSLAAQVFSFEDPIHGEGGMDAGGMGNEEGNGGQGENEDIPGGEGHGNTLMLFKKFGSDRLEFSLGADKSLLGYAIFDTTGRRVQYGNPAEIETSSIDVSRLETSLYYLRLYLDGENWTGAFFRD